MRSRQRRELRSSIRKSFILDKAEGLFWDKGYNGTSMRDIASACNCKPANIYNFFESKEDILFEVIRDIVLQLLEYIIPFENDQTTKPKDLLKAVIKSHFGFLVNMKRSIVGVTDTGLRDLTPEHRKEIIELRSRYDSIVQQILHRGVELGEFADIDEKLVSYFISSIIIRSNIWYSEKGRLTADQVSDTMFDFVYRGIKA